MTAVMTSMADCALRRAGCGSCAGAGEMLVPTETTPTRMVAVPTRNRQEEEERARIGGMKRERPRGRSRERMANLLRE